MSHMNDVARLYTLGQAEGKFERPEQWGQGYGRVGQGG
jgi:hypothetical protein